MSDPERIIAQATDLVRSWSADPRRSARLRRKKRRFVRIVKGALVLMFATFVVIPTMIASGFLLGPNGTEGLVAAPLVLLLTWVAVWYWVFGRRASPRVIVQGDLPQLPLQTGDWLEEQRALLPGAAQPKLDSLAVKLENLTPQLQALSADAPAAQEVRRLLGEELPELIRVYRKVPRALAQKPLYGGASPERQLIEGLDTIDTQIGRLHERLATEDMHALATHQRYLDLKYNRKDEIE